MMQQKRLSGCTNVKFRSNIKCSCIIMCSMTATESYFQMNFALFHDLKYNVDIRNSNNSLLIQSRKYGNYQSISGYVTGRETLRVIIFCNPLFSPGLLLPQSQIHLLSWVRLNNNNYSSRINYLIRVDGGEQK